MNALTVAGVVILVVLSTLGAIAGLGFMVRETFRALRKGDKFDVIFNTVVFLFIVAFALIAAGTVVGQHA